MGISIKRKRNETRIISKWSLIKTNKAHVQIVEIGNDGGSHNITGKDIVAHTNHLKSLENSGWKKRGRTWRTCSKPSPDDLGSSPSLFVPKELWYILFLRRIKCISTAAKRGSRFCRITQNKNHTFERLLIANRS